MKLNLGCGKVYKPGYVNIDSSDSSVADENWDVLDLPLKDSSVDLIEADQLVEHFDWVNIRYLFAEWWRVLRKGGKLIIETPDLLGTFRRLKKAQGEAFLVESQWMFGIDTRGQRHGMVFKEKELKGMLMSSGFTDIESLPQSTYIGEPGLRLECTKVKAEGRRKVETLFRKRVRKVYKGDSYLLIPIEDLMKDLIFSLTIDGEPREPIFTKNFFKAAVVDPVVPEHLLLAMKACRKSVEMPDELMDALTFMNDEQIKCRSFSLWMKRRKGADVRRSFQEFIEDLSSRLRLNLMSTGDPGPELQYLLSLEPEDIRMLDLRIMADRAKEWSNMGIRAFHEGMLDEAKDLFDRSLSAIPSNPIAHWNLARINYKTGNISDALKGFDKAIKLLSDRSLIKEAKREQEMMRRGGIEMETVGPRSETFV